MSLKALSSYTIYAKYAHYLPEKKRRETWEEITDRVFAMHARKYASQLASSEEFREEFEFAKDMVKQKRVLGSQRALQFGGKWIEDHETKIYNCTFSHIDRPRVFQEISYMLLCGCGVGFSVQKHHAAKLPKITPVSAETVTEKIADSIEGWSDAVGALMASYFHGGPTVLFDYSLIRPAGALIAGQFKAPGPKGLEKSLEKIRSLINRRLTSPTFATDEFAGRLRPIDCYDIIMHIGDSVLSGGIRRSATISLFSHDDTEMMAAKTGNWYVDNPQRGRSNNSVLLVRSETTWDQFKQIIKSTKEFGEPGFYFASSTEHGANPCQPAWAPVLTEKGLSTMGAIKEGDRIWSETGWTTVTKKWSTGVKPVYRYQTTAGVFFGTENHRVVSNGEKIEARLAESIDRLSGPFVRNLTIDPQDVMDGVVFGDGSVHGASNDLVYLCIGKDDTDYHHSEISGLIREHRPGLTDYAWEVATTISAAELPYTFNRSIPDRFIYASPDKVAGFLRGLYTANGSVVSDRITLKASSLKVIEQVQMMLSSLGIGSYYTTNRPTRVQFSNGEYLCKESYDLNITRDRAAFGALIGFIQLYKTDKVDALLKREVRPTKSRKTAYDVISVSQVSEEEVFDITVDNAPHTYWTGGLNVSNCVEIGLYPKTSDGRSGFQMCNLCEINGKRCDTEERFLESCRAAAIIGTMQAGYTDFRYLSKESAEITAREALLGVSITGVMDNPEVLLSPKTQRAGAAMCKETNRRIAAILGVNPAARITCTKPAGSTSCVLQTASGIHPHHARRYLRRVQANELEFPLQHYKAINPDAVETSVWSANGTDDVISFACEVPKGAILKNDLDAVALLGKVKSSQANWVLEGENPELAVSPGIHHNISNTISIREDEWDKVARYIYDNREFFTGISLLSSSGDLDYPQAPFATVLTPEELVREYGDGSILASGLVVDGLHAFDGNLWAACDQASGMRAALEDLVDPVEPVKPLRKAYKNDKSFSNALADYAIQLNLFYQDMSKYREVAAQKDWCRRAKQFAERYFAGDLRRATYCMKHVSLWHTWLAIKRTHKEIDWSTAVEDTQDYVAADTLASAACVGGACELK